MKKNTTSEFNAAHKASTQHGIESAMRRLLTLSLYLTLYFTAAPGVIVVNKIIMKSGEGFPYPAFVSALGQGATVLLSHCLVHTGVVGIRPIAKSVNTSTFVYIGALSALSLTLGQYAYMYLTIAFIQMLKSC